ncbi:MAG: SDR family NAD(P)-dependent oxidoreductase, partial [bacterium]|nr:SDR family NAD(P)-dependent oxidoreductase [bacterium]
MTASPAEQIDLTGRVVVVTGAGGGIGAGIIRRMAAAGASVVAHTRSSAVDQSGGEVVEVRADLTDNEGPAAVVSAAR